MSAPLNGRTRGALLEFLLACGALRDSITARATDAESCRALREETLTQMRDHVERKASALFGEIQTWDLELGSLAHRCWQTPSKQVERDQLAAEIKAQRDRRE